jgi:hypothetical protein
VPDGSNGTSPGGLLPGDSELSSATWSLCGQIVLEHERAPQGFFDSADKTLLCSASFRNLWALSRRSQGSEKTTACLAPLPTEKYPVHSTLWRLRVQPLSISP